MLMQEEVVLICKSADFLVTVGFKFNFAFWTMNGMVPRALGTS